MMPCWVYPVRLILNDCRRLIIGTPEKYSWQEGREKEEFSDKGLLF
jgi:hypothetical protein